LGTDHRIYPPPVPSYDAGTVQLLILCSDDFTHLGYVWQLAEEYGKARDTMTRRRVGLGYIRRLLSDGMVVAGEMRSDTQGLVHWRGTADEVIRQIEHLITEVGREPTLGDNAYLVATERGDEVARALRQ